MGKESEKIQRMVDRCAAASAGKSGEVYYSYDLWKDLAELPPDSLAMYVSENFHKLAGK